MLWNTNTIQKINEFKTEMINDNRIFSVTIKNHEKLQGVNKVVATVSYILVNKTWKNLLYCLIYEL